MPTASHAVARSISHSRLEIFSWTKSIEHDLCSRSDFLRKTAHTLSIPYSPSLNSLDVFGRDVKGRGWSVRLLGHIFTSETLGQTTCSVDGDPRDPPLHAIDLSSPLLRIKAMESAAQQWALRADAHTRAGEFAEADDATTESRALLADMGAAIEMRSRCPFSRARVRRSRARRQHKRRAAAKPAINTVITVSPC